MTATEKLRAKHEALIAHMDSVGRERALTSVESLLLQRSLAFVAGRRVEHGVNKDLARHGIATGRFPALEALA